MLDSGEDEFMLWHETGPHIYPTDQLQRRCNITLMLAVNAAPRHNDCQTKEGQAVAEDRRDYFAECGVDVSYNASAYEGRGVYSSLEIKQARTAGHIIIHPYLEANIRGSSVDVTLGEWFYRTEQTGNFDYYNPFSPRDVQRYFGSPEQAIPHSDWCARYGKRLFDNIPADHPIIVLRPGERILAHTHEFIGIRPPGTTEMRARSSWGRNGVAACFDAGWGDPGYINRWTMEVFNLNAHDSIPLPVGERVAQMIFHHTGAVEEDYGATGKYQAGVDLRDIVENWRPEGMLPRAYKDERHKPLPINLPAGEEIKLR